MYSGLSNPGWEGRLKLEDCDWLWALESQFVVFRMVSGFVWFCFSLFFKWVCQTFFISLSVRPGNLAAMADHLKNGGKQISLMMLISIYVLVEMAAIRRKAYF